MALFGSAVVSFPSQTGRNRRIDMTEQIVVNLWWKGILLAISLASVGVICATVFNATTVGKLLAGIGVFALVVLSIWLGFILTIYSFERGEIRHIDDGKDEVSIAFYIGPFEMRRVLPYKGDRQKD
jgi:hypothetical protein